MQSACKTSLSLTEVRQKDEGLHTGEVLYNCCGKKDTIRLSQGELQKQEQVSSLTIYS